jgi:hypothetical protein
MKILRYLAGGAALAALVPVIFISAAQAAPAHAAAPARTAIAASVSCPTLYKGFLDNVPESLVDTWDSGTGVFVARTSGHTDLCLVNEKLVNNVAYWELEDYGVGNDCMTADNGPTGALDLSGCKAGQTDELFTGYYSSQERNLAYGNDIQANGNGDTMFLNTPNSGNYSQDWVIKPG